MYDIIVQTSFKKSIPQNVFEGCFLIYTYTLGKEIIFSLQGILQLHQYLLD